MKKLYSLMLMAVVVAMASFTAKADVACTVTWDTPGSVYFYVGSTAESAKVVPAADATSYTASIAGQTYGSLYVYAADGYILEGGVCQDDNKTLSMSGNRLIVNMSASQHGSHNIKLNCKKLEYDGNINVNLVSGGEVTVALDGTYRTLTLVGGENKIPVSSTYDKTILFQAKNTGSANPYLKKNGVETEWKNFYGTLKATLDVANGDVFEVKYNDEEPKLPEQVVTHTVTLNLEGDALAALEMVRNFTQSKTIAARDQFEVNEGDVYTLVFNTRDYTVSVNGEPLAPNPDGQNTVWKSEPVTADVSVSATAKEREYGQVNVTFMVDNPENVVLRDGSVDGPVVDLSAYTPVPASFNGYDYKSYTVPVGAKYSKLYVSAADGCWLEECQYGSASEPDESGVVMPGYSNFRIKATKIVRDQKFVVYLDNTTDPSNLRLRDQQFNTYTLEKGYNEFMIDPRYSTPFQVLPMNVTDNMTFNVVNNYTKVALDSESNTYKFDANAGGQVVHVFMKNLPALRTVTVNETGVEGTTVTVDKITREVTADNNAFKSYNNFEVTVTPGEGAKVVSKDGAEVELAEGVYTFKPTANTEISVANPAVMVVTPANGSTVDAFDAVYFSFPYATSVEQAMDDVNELTLSRGQAWANWGWTVEPVEAESGVTIKATPNFKVPNGLLTVYLPEGFFSIDGKYTNEETIVNFTLERAVGEINYQFDPGTDELANDGNGLYLAIVFDEDYEVELATEDINDFEVKLGDKVLEYYTDYDLTWEQNFFMVAIKGSSIEGLTGQLSLSIAEGALSVSGASAPAISHVWNVVAPKEYLLEAAENWAEGLDKEAEFEVVITFNGASKAELFNEYGIQLAENNYVANRYSQAPAKVEEVNDEVQAYADEAAAPSMKLTFPSLYSVKGDGYDYTKPLPMTLTVREGAFTLDGYAASPAFTKEYNFLTTGIGSIEVEFDGEARYYNLQGVEVKNPAAGQVYIKVVGKKASKVQR